MPLRLPIPLSHAAARRPLALLCGLALSCGVAGAQAPLPDAPRRQVDAVPAGAPAAQQASPHANDAAQQAPADPETVFPHSETARYWISGQVNVIMQLHGRFRALYNGPNSFTNWAQSATTHVMTLYTGYQLTRTTAAYADVEDATGNGLGNANGMAGYVNLDSVRLVQGVPLSKSPYLARLMIEQTVPLSKERTDAERDELHLAASLPARRLDFRVGKFDLVDFFDVNTWGSDSHLQFMNWTVDNNGAYDYAANTRGYTDGAMVEYDDRWMAARFATTLMPKTANGDHLDADLARARAQNLELEAHGDLFKGRPGAVRLLSYVNRADMGNYEQAIREFEDGKTAAPNIIATRQQGRHRYGFGLNFEQAVTAHAGLFGRLGWSDGRNESYCYTEDDRALELGWFSTGQKWHRPGDRAGVAYSENGIVAAHRQYLALGGLGFLLGDGALDYGHEKIVESFYTAHLWRGFFVSYDLQHFNDPGYNQARGPVTISGFRFHTDF